MLSQGGPNKGGPHPLSFNPLFVEAAMLSVPSRSNAMTSFCFNPLFVEAAMLSPGPPCPGGIPP